MIRQVTHRPALRLATARLRVVVKSRMAKFKMVMRVKSGMGRSRMVDLDQSIKSGMGRSRMVDLDQSIKSGMDRFKTEGAVPKVAALVTKLEELAEAQVL
jgi:hypothetical protein